MHKALLICNSTYPNDPATLHELNGPQLDGLLMWRSLTDRSTGLFSPHRITVLFERTANEILRASEEFFADANPGDVLLYYYSGHGRKIGGDLFLCGRDTTGTRLVSSAVPAGSIRHMIDRASAEATIVILDCCHSGAFKGMESIAKDFSGSGRFVLAASRASELASDATEKGQPSPFTEAIVNALSGHLAAGEDSEIIDLDDLYRSIYKAMSDSACPEPRKSFDGSGNVAIARTISREKVAEKQTSNVSQTFVNPREPDSSLRHRIRSRGDYSLGDLGTVFLYFLIAVIGSGLAATVLSFGLSGPYSTWDKIPNGAIGLSVLTLILCTTLTVSSAFEALIRRKLLPRRFRCKDVTRLFEDRRFRKVRRFRHTIASAGAIAPICVTSSEFQSSNIAWLCLVALMSCVAITGITSLLQFGDAPYMAGAFILIISPFLPLGRSGVESLDILQILVAITMFTAWTLRSEQPLLAVPALAGLTPFLLSVIGEQFSVSILSGAIGAAVSIASVVVGCGLQLEDGKSYRFGVINRHQGKPAEGAVSALRS